MENLKIIGWRGNDTVYSDENGGLHIKSNEAEMVNRKVSELNFERRRCTKLVQEYTEMQHILRVSIKNMNMSDAERRKVDKVIFENRIILRGLKTRLTQVKRWVRNWSKVHPKNMLPRDLQ